MGIINKLGDDKNFADDMKFEQVSVPSLNEMGKEIKETFDFRAMRLLARFYLKLSFPMLLIGVFVGWLIWG